MRVLITCGPTWVPIDDVRIISNQSTGEMGHLIAQECLARGFQVTLIEGAVTHAWENKRARVVKYQYFDELNEALNVELKKKYDVVMHAAAVSDFKLKTALKGKISSAKALTLKLVPTIKLIDVIKNKAPKARLVGFKLIESLDDPRVAEQVEALFEKSRCDLVLVNTLENGYKGFVIDRQANIVAKANNKMNLVKQLIKNL